MKIIKSRFFLLKYLTFIHLEIKGNSMGASSFPFSSQNYSMLHKDERTSKEHVSHSQWGVFFKPLIVVSSSALQPTEKVNRASCSLGVLDKNDDWYARTT